MTDLLVLAQLLEVSVLVAHHLHDLLLHLARNPELGLQQAAESGVVLTRGMLPSVTHLRRMLRCSVSVRP